MLVETDGGTIDTTTIAPPTFTDVDALPLLQLDTGNYIYTVGGAENIANLYIDGFSFVNAPTPISGPVRREPIETTGPIIGVELLAGKPALTISTTYVSGTPITASATYSGTLGELNLKAGEFLFDWGADSITFSIPGSTVGGVVRGLVGSITLQNNTGAELTLAKNGSFSFPEELVFGESYDVTIVGQPGGQTCSVGNGRGVIKRDNIGSVTVTCSVLAIPALPFSMLALSGALMILVAWRQLRIQASDGRTL
ncbi:MAG: hypothetical protein V2I24_06350 [Halieaceae bacterium]|nr:hypothetical protein [Halieaceae bacterium]